MCFNVCKSKHKKRCREKRNLTEILNLSVNNNDSYVFKTTSYNNKSVINNTNSNCSFDRGHLQNNNNNIIHEISLRNRSKKKQNDTVSSNTNNTHSTKKQNTN